MRTRTLLSSLIVGLALVASESSRAAGPTLRVEEVAREPERGVLKLRNNTPFIMLIYVAKVRIAWVKPFRNEQIRGLKDGRHKLYAHSQYGSASFGPRSVTVPGTLNITADSKESDLDTALASKIFQANKASLIACDKIAERRGEEVSGRADFEVQVDAAGKGQASVAGEGLGEGLLSCYRSVAKQWKYPETGSPYTVSFQHLH